MPPSSSSDPAAPGGKTHLQAVADHLAHGDWLRATGRNDHVTVGWAITALFYSAVHAVRAYLKACKNVDVTSHDDLKDKLFDYPELKRTKFEYDLLKQQSHSARYYCNPNFTWADFEKLKPKAEKVASTWKSLAERCLSTSGTPPS